MRLHLLAALGLLLAAFLPAHGAGTEDASPTPMPRVTASFSGADLIEALYHLFRDTGLRYEAPRDARELFAASLEEVPLERALRIVLAPRGFTFTREGDLYRITRQQDYRPIGAQLAEEQRERRHRWEAEFANRPITPKKREPRVRFLYSGGSMQGMQRPIVGMAPGSYLNAFGPPPGPSPRIPASPAQPVDRQRTTQPLSIGPITLPVPLPAGLRLFPGGGFQYQLPVQGETQVTGPMGTYTVPFTAPGLTVRRR